MLKICHLSLCFLLFSFRFLYIFHCNVQLEGPVFPSLPRDKAVPLAGRYIFPVKVPFYKKNLLGELVLEKSKNSYGTRRKTYFSMRVLGQNLQDSIRVRSYEGLAYQINPNIMELRSERCYVSGKRDWEDRLIALEKWNCDHLFFSYESPSNFARRETLRSVQTDRTRYSDWFLPEKLIPIPFKRASLKNLVFFAGQIIPLEDTLKTKLVVVWGYQGARLLREGDILTAQDETGEKVGEMKVISRPGDFIICQWMDVPVAKAKIAYKLEFPFKHREYADTMP